MKRAWPAAAPAKGIAAPLPARAAPQGASSAAHRGLNMLTVTHSRAFHVPAAARAFGPRRRAPVFKPLARCLINGEPGGGRIAAVLENA